MAKKLVDPQNAHNLKNWIKCPISYLHALEPLNSSHLDQSDNLSRLPNVTEVLEGDEGEGDVEGEEGEEVDQVHRLDEELRLHRTAQQSEKYLKFFFSD